MRALLMAAGALGLFACVAPPLSNSSGAASQPSTQVILKLKGAADVSQPEILARLSNTTGVIVRYVRPMSGGAHVVALPGSLTAGELEQAVRAMAGLPEVAYAEVDRFKTHY